MGKQFPSLGITHMILQATELTKKFDTLIAVNGVSFAVAEGEIFGLIGPDGAGKTTTLRMVSGIMVPSGGELSVFGLSLPAEAEGVKEHLGYMSQKFNLYPDLTVDENMRFFADIFGVSRAERAERLEPLLHMTRMKDFRDRPAGDLSGGMKQKLALMCTLIHRPRLLVLDEPTTGVDPVSRREFWEMLHHIRAEGVTILVSTPYMDEAEWCSRVALMFNGKLISCDTPQNLKTGLGSVVAEVMAQPGTDVAALKNDIAGIGGVRDVQVFGASYHVIADTAAVIEQIAASSRGRAAVRQIPPSIEDVFVTKIGASRE